MPEISQPGDFSAIFAKARRISPTLALARLSLFEKPRRKIRYNLSVRHWWALRSPL